MSTHRISFKYRLLPTKAQETRLCATVETCRHLYNRFLAERKEAFEATGTAPNYYAQKARLPEWKADNEYLPGGVRLCEVHSQVLQDVCKRVDLAFQAFFRRVKAGENRGERLRAGYPRFKGTSWYDSFTFPQSGFSLNETTLTLSKIGALKTIVHRPLQGQVKTCTIRRQNGKWYACFSCEVETQALPENSATIGVDVGLEKFASLSDGTFIENPRFYRHDEKALAKAQRRLSKFEKGTKERHRARKVVSRIHERIRNRRHNFVHQEARKMVNEFGTIAVEKLSPKQMMKNHCLAKSIGDAAWSQFRQVICNKAESAGRKYVEVSPAYTSQTCSGCGVRAKKKLSQRWHLCPDCGTSLDRDTNAALNIISLGLQRIGTQSVEAPTFMRGE